MKPFYLFLTESKSEYLFGHCGVFAVAIHQRTGWPIVNFTKANGQLVHSAVQMPDGRFLDYEGIVTPESLATRYKIQGQLRQTTVPIGGPVAGFNAEGTRSIEDAIKKASDAIDTWDWRHLLKQ